LSVTDRCSVEEFQFVVSGVTDDLLRRAPAHEKSIDGDVGGDADE